MFKQHAMIAAVCAATLFAGQALAQTAADPTSEPAGSERPAEESTQKAQDASTETTQSQEPAASSDPASDSSESSASEEKAGGSTEPAKNQSATDTKPESLTVASWGGAYTQSQERAYFKPFEDETGIEIKIISHKGRFEPLEKSAGDGAPGWDIVDLDLATLERGCKSGVLEKIELTALAAAEGGEPATTDFLPGSLHDCGVPSVAWSSTIVFDKRAFKKKKPESASDFFDVKRFPGKRALPDNPKYVFELALMADGEEPDNVYKSLEGDDGIKRVFKRLDAIRDHIVWWNSAHEPLVRLAKQEATMALAFNGRVFSAIVAENKPFGIVWDAQIFDLDFWAIPKRTANKTSSMEFIAFATRPERLARQASWYPYGPVRKSALSLIGKHPVIDVDMATYIPTSQSNFKRALRMDSRWWSEHAERMQDHFMVWKIGDGGSAQTGEDAEREGPDG